MITKNKLVFDTLDFLYRNHISDDIDIDERQIMYLWNIQRALWISNEYNKPGRTIDSDIEQDLGCVELVLASPYECCDIDLDDQCKVLRTKEKIPKPLNLNIGLAITRVAPVNKILTNKNVFSFVPYNTIDVQTSNKYTGRSTYSFYLNGYVYIITSQNWVKLLKYINIRGVFEDPEEVKNFNNCDGSSCYDDNSAYPMPGKYIAYIRDYVIEGLLRSLSIPKDEQNNAKDDVEIRTK